MEIIFHAHKAVISQRMRDRAERLVAKLGRRSERIVEAIVRFERDGPVRRVEIMLHAPRRKAMIGEGFGRTYGPALTQAGKALEAQLAHRKRTPKARGRALARV